MADGMRVCVVGLGRIGFALSTLIASAGHTVMGLDMDPLLVAAIHDGSYAPEEPGTEPLYRTAREKGRYDATTDPREAVPDADVVVIIVPVPLGSDKRPELSALVAACEAVGRHLSPGTLVVVESTLPPGTMEGAVRRTLEGAAGKVAGRDFFLAHSPERVMSGTILEQMSAYPKIIGALTDAGRERAMAFYLTFCPNAMPMPNLVSAELEKVVEGVYRDVNIALANQLARVCEAQGADFAAVRAAANSQPFCHLHRPSAGVGGLCIPVYPYFLPEQGPPDLVRTSRALNEAVPRFVADRALELAGEGASILVLGLAFRAGVRDLRLSPSLEIVRALRDAGRTVRVFDPNFSPEEIMEATGCASEREGDFVLVLTAEETFEKLLDAYPGTAILDCTGQFPRSAFRIGRNVDRS